CRAARIRPTARAITSATTGSTKCGTTSPASGTLSPPGWSGMCSAQKISPNIAAAWRAPEMVDFTAEEMMTVAAARLLRDGIVCFVGIGLPSAAANLARVTHAPGIVLIYESGTIGAKPTALPLSIGDGELAETADALVSVPEMFRYWLQGGRIDVGFLGAAQVDRYGTINTTVIGQYHRPTVRLPGAGGAPEIATLAGEVFIILRHGKRALVEHLDFITSPSLRAGDRIEGPGRRGKGPTALVTDLGILKPDPQSRE